MIQLHWWWSVTWCDPSLWYLVLGLQCPVNRIGYLGTNHSIKTRLRWLPRNDSLVQIILHWLHRDESPVQILLHWLPRDESLVKIILHCLPRDEPLVQNSFTLVTSGRITRSKLFYTGYLGTNHSFKTLLHLLPRDESLVQNFYTGSKYMSLNYKFV